VNIPAQAALGGSQNQAPALPDLLSQSAKKPIAQIAGRRKISCQQKRPLKNSAQSWQSVLAA
jgi:hypothetical protein